MTAKHYVAIAEVSKEFCLRAVRHGYGRTPDEALADLQGTVAAFQEKIIGKIHIAIDHGQAQESQS